MLVGMRHSPKSCTKKGLKKNGTRGADNRRLGCGIVAKKERETAIRTNPSPLQTLNHMENIKCNYKSIITTEDEFIQFAFFTPAALAGSFATDTKAHCDQKIQIHDK